MPTWAYDLPTEKGPRFVPVRVIDHRIPGISPACTLHSGNLCIIHTTITFSLYPRCFRVIGENWERASENSNRRGEGFVVLKIGIGNWFVGENGNV